MGLFSFFKRKKKERNKEVKSRNTLPYTSPKSSSGSIAYDDTEKPFQEDHHYRSWTPYSHSYSDGGGSTGYSHSDHSYHSPSNDSHSSSDSSSYDSGSGDCGGGDSGGGD